MNDNNIILGGPLVKKFIHPGGEYGHIDPPVLQDRLSYPPAPDGGDGHASGRPAPVKEGGGTPRSLGLKMDRLNTIRVHPDGKRIAFVAGLGKAEVWMMENFLPAQKKKN